jgi:hypothetical protein
MRILLPSPTPHVVVAHSPTPSVVRMAARSYGDGRNALAACDSWCSGKKAARRSAERRLEDAVELEDRLLVEGDRVDLGAAGLGEAVAERVHRHRLVVLLAGEALLLRGCDDHAVLDEAGGGVVVVAGEAEGAEGAAHETL